MARHDEPGTEYLEAIRRGFRLAREQGRGCGPADILLGLAEGPGPVAAALDPGPGRSLRLTTSPGGAVPGGAVPDSGAGYLHMQAQGAATALARSLGQQPRPEHLLIALLDQGTPEVLRTLSAAGLDRTTVRAAALAAVGAPAGHPPIGMPAPAAAGTMDRPPLPVGDLDPRAWGVLRWRQDHLPLSRLRRAGDRQALARLERAAADRVAGHLGLGDDQRHSLIRHHADRVDRLMTEMPGTAAPPRPARLRGTPGLTPLAVPGAQDARARFSARRRRLRRRGFLRFTVGWGAWVRNRRAALNDRWIWLRTWRDYRGCPQP